MPKEIAVIEPLPPGRDFNTYQSTYMHLSTLLFPLPVPLSASGQGSFLVSPFSVCKSTLLSG